MDIQPAFGHTAFGGAPDHAPADLFDRLVGGVSQRNVFDAHVFACILAHRWSGGLARLGLTPRDLAALLARYFPAAAAEGLRPPDAPRSLTTWENRERKDIEALLLRHRAGDRPEEAWLAQTLARACIDDAPLWQGLGLDGPRHLTAVFARHFPGLVAFNPEGRRWKQMIYRLICADLGLLPCRGPGPCAATCAAEAQCFGSGW